jgi:hypothetical protein
VTNASASNPFWPKLRKKAKVGCTTFAAGISSRSVIAAAERAYEYSQNPPFEAERIERLGALLNQIHGAPVSEEFAAAKVKALLWHELTPGDYWAFPMKQDIIGRDPRADYVHVFGEPGSLYIEDQLDGITLISDAHDNNQYVRAVRVERGEVDFYPAYKTTGRTIEPDSSKE